MVLLLKWRRVWSWLGSATTPELTLAAAALFLLVLLSAALGQPLERLVIRLLEGYGWPDRIKRLSTRHQRQKYDDTSRQFQTAAKMMNSSQVTIRNRDEFVRADLERLSFPANPDDLMPTKLGNVLRASERRVKEKYGLDIVICWPRLWILLPEGARKDLSEARSKLDSGARSWLWGMLFLIWIMWAWWAILVTLAATIVAYVWIVDAARTYGDLVESSFDVQRSLLYNAVRWPLPANAASEIESGKALTEYLWRGSDSEFVHLKI